MPRVQCVQLQDEIVNEKYCLACRNVIRYCYPVPVCAFRLTAPHHMPPPSVAPAMLYCLFCTLVLCVFPGFLWLSPAFHARLVTDAYLSEVRSGRRFSSAHLVRNVAAGSLARPISAYCCCFPVYYQFVGLCRAVFDCKPALLSPVNAAPRHCWPNR